MLLVEAIKPRVEQSINFPYEKMLRKDIKRPTEVCVELLTVADGPADFTFRVYLQSKSSEK